MSAGAAGGDAEQGSGREAADVAGVREGRLATVAGAVLLGGASTRFGSDKAAFEIDGVACATRVARQLAAIVEDVMLVGGTPPADAPGRRVPDGPGDRCAMRGWLAALEAARAPQLLVVATDLPFVTRALLLALIAQPTASAVVPRPDGRPQPLCALYDVAAVLPIVRDQFAAGRYALRSVLDQLPSTRFLDPPDLLRLDPTARALTNLNTPGTLTE